VNFKMYSRSAKGGEKGDPNRNPWLAKMEVNICCYESDVTRNNFLYSNVKF